MEERQRNSTGLTERERGGWQEAEMKRVKGGEEGVRCVRGGVWQKLRLIHGDCRAERMLNPRREGGKQVQTGENKRETDCKEWMWRWSRGGIKKWPMGPDVPGQFTVGRAAWLISNSLGRRRAFMVVCCLWRHIPAAIRDIYRLLKHSLSVRVKFESNICFHGSLHLTHTRLFCRLCKHRHPELGSYIWISQTAWII